MTIKTLTTEEMDVLRSIIGMTIDSFEGCPLGPGDYYGAIRLNSSFASIDVSNFFEQADVSFEEGMGFEDVGTIHVKYSDGPLSFGDLVSGPATKCINLGLVVKGVEIVNDTIEMMLDGKVTNTFSFTQAIIFHFEKGDLVIDRNVWFEVILSACFTGDAAKYIRNTEKDWNNGSGRYRAVVKREFIAL